jgi:hypothetical protein
MKQTTFLAQMSLAYGALGIFPKKCRLQTPCACGGTQFCRVEKLRIHNLNENNLSQVVYSNGLE